MLKSNGYVQELRTTTNQLRDGQSIKFSQFASVPLPVPPLAEQRAIADYLDAETAKIDALITKQQQLIATLRERRAAAAASDATKGTSTPATLKPSGLDWAGEIPAHWRVARLRDVARMESGHTPSRTREDLWENCYIPWVSLNDTRALTTNEYIYETSNLISDAGIANSSARLLPAGTVVLSRDATIGRSSIIGVPMATSQHFAAWVCGPNLLPRYLWLLFTSAMQTHFNSLTDGATLRTIGMPDLRAFAIPLPPVEEQLAICEYAAAQTAKADALIAKTERFIELSRERRAALITAAVTGQIDVQEVPR
jgi:type I restriction enzyme S subunit